MVLVAFGIFFVNHVRREVFFFLFKLFAFYFLFWDPQEEVESKRCLRFETFLLFTRFSFCSDVVMACELHALLVFFFFLSEFWRLLLVQKLRFSWWLKEYVLCKYYKGYRKSVTWHLPCQSPSLANTLVVPCVLCLWGYPFWLRHPISMWLNVRTLRLSLASKW